MIDKFIQKEVQNLIDEYHKKCKEDNKLIYNSCLEELEKVTVSVYLVTNNLFYTHNTNCGCSRTLLKYTLRKENNITIEVSVSDDIFYENKGRDCGHTPNCNETFERPKLTSERPKLTFFCDTIYNIY